MTDTTLSPRFDRMNISANRCEDIVHDSFHMPRFASTDWTRTSCGTAGCLAGYCVNWFHKEGIYLADRFHDNISWGAVPVMNWKTGFQALAELYQIPYSLAEWLVSERITEFKGKQLPSYTQEYPVESFSAITPRHVAHRIRKVIVMLGGTVQKDYPVEKHVLEVVS